jgi:hypothetical protein
MTREEFYQLVGAIGHHLDGWTAAINDQRYGNTAIFSGPDDLSFYLAKSSHDRRLHVTPSYNGLTQYLPHGSKRLAITISPSRPPAAIAADIARRFLPAFTDEMRACRQAADRHAANVAQAEANTAALLAASQGLLTRSYTLNRRDTLISLHGSYRGQSTLSAEVSHDRATLHLLSLPPDLAATIVAAIAQHLPTSQPPN